MRYRGGARLISGGIGRCAGTSSPGCPQRVSNLAQIAPPALALIQIVASVRKRIHSSVMQ
jgi:hypothetical protein